MPMPALLERTQSWQLCSRNKISSHVEYHRARRENLDAAFIHTLRASRKEENRALNKKPWEIGIRRIFINDYLDIKHAVTLHHCSSIEILPHYISVSSSYSPDKLLIQLRRIFSGIPNLYTLKLNTIDYLELKTAIPQEFATSHYLSSIGRVKKLPAKRYQIESIYYSEPESGISVECYRLKGAKIFACIYDGQLRSGRVLRDRTNKLLLRPLEFRFDLKKLRKNIRIPSAVCYTGIIKILKKYIFDHFLFKSNGQLCVPLLLPPRPWRNAFKLSNRIIKYAASKGLKPVPAPVWPLRNSGINPARAQYINNLLSEPYYQDLKNEWQSKYAFCTHDDVMLEVDQLDKSFRVASLENEFIPMGISRKQLSLYSDYRVYQMQAGKRKMSLRRWAHIFIGANIPINVSRRYGKYLDGKTHFFRRNIPIRCKSLLVSP